MKTRRKNDDPANIATLCASCHKTLHWEEDGLHEKFSRRVTINVDALDRLLDLLIETLPTLEPSRRLALEVAIVEVRGGLPPSKVAA